MLLCFCSNLSNVTIENGVGSIGNAAFQSCTSLTKITIPASVTFIDSTAFNGCTSLTNIQVDVNNINYSSQDGILFNKNQTELIRYPQGKAVASYTIPDTVTSIGYCAFFRCDKLTNITIPNSVTSIGIVAFGSCAFTSITIPNSVTTIGESAFKECIYMENITFEANSQLTSIGVSAFYNCNALKSIDIPYGVTSISENTFQNCSGLKSVTIPESVTSIGNNSFNKCDSLTSIYIPSNVESIGISAFAGCEKITNIEFGENSKLKTIGTYAFLGCKITSIDIPDGVTLIGQQAFSSTDLTSIVIPYSVTSIGKYAFSNCRALDCIFLPDKEDLSIGMDAIPNNTTRVKYSLNNNEVTITEIKLGNEKTNVAIPDTICGYEVVEVASNEWSKVGKHTHKGSQATCIEKSKCRICGQEYGELKNHNLKHFDAKEATVAKAGNIEYWYCIDCEKYFSDENGTKEISFEDTIISRLAPEIIAGKGQSVTQGEKKALSFTSNASYNEFKYVKLDGETLDSKHYTVKEGSIIVTLNKDFVSTLKAGKHTISIVSETGEATTEFEVVKKEVVKDNSKKENSNKTNTGLIGNAGLWISMMTSSINAMLIGLILHKKNKK
ncbi:leucine-rich repeat domain-containing protein [Floccifex sp.]|uniref:leucine-rich repeat domain-containing protein n=1 Tax=Floccifex sp. TaxID=2815810 RepID=UPI003F04F9A4